MDYKTKRTVLSSSVVISSFIVSLVCAIILIVTLGNGTGDLPGTTEVPKNTTPAIITTTSPITTTPPVTSNATPTQTYHNTPYTTGPQATRTPELTMSVTSEPPTPTDEYDTVELLAFGAKLISFNSTTAKYELTMSFNASGTVKLVAINSDRNLTGTDITPNFIRNTIKHGVNLDKLSTTASLTSGVATANTPLTLTITTGLKPVDYFIIIDTDDENGLMSESIVKQNYGDTIPTIIGCSTPGLDADGDLTFEVTLSKDATIFVQLGENSLGTLFEQTTNGKATFTTNCKEEYAGISLIAYLKYNDITGDKVPLTTVPQDINSLT